MMCKFSRASIKIIFFYVPFIKDKLIPIYSAFNGIGIYKKHLLKLYNYDFCVNEQVKLFYRNYLKKNTISNDIINIINSKCNKFPNGYKDELTDIFWKSNSGYDKPVICEHVPLNFALHNSGYKLFINPKMIYNR